jgi:hypothetical protein
MSKQQQTPEFNRAYIYPYKFSFPFYLFEYYLWIAILTPAPKNL